MEYLRRGVIVGAEWVDGEDDFGDGASRVIGRRLERARDEGRTFHEPHCSLRFARVQELVNSIVSVAIFLAASGAASLLVHGATEREEPLTK